MPQKLIDEALQEDPARAGAEYLAEFRTDVESFVDREVVESAVVTVCNLAARLCAEAKDGQ